MLGGEGKKERGQRLGQGGQVEDTEEKRECWRPRQRCWGWSRWWSGVKGRVSDSWWEGAHMGFLGEPLALLLLNSSPPECTANSALQETSPARLRAVQV